MKYTSIFILTAAVVAGSVETQAQFVTGFDFNNINDAQNVGNRSANFGSSTARNYFTLYTENSAYSSDTDPYSGMVANAGSGWWQADDDLGGGAGRAADGGVHTVRGSLAGAGASPAGFTLGNVVNAGNALHLTGAVNGGWFSFGLDAGGDGFSTFQDLRVDFQVRALGDTFAVQQNWWLMGADSAADIAAGDFSSALDSGSFLPTTDYANWGFDLGDVASGSLLVFGVSTTNVDAFDIGPSSGIYYDNVTFNGSVIPEPSTYAAVAGLLALGTAAWFRRRRRAS